MFSSIIGESITLVSFLEIIIVSMVCGLISSKAYQKCGSFTKNFIITLAVLPVLVSMVILMVNGNLGTGIAVMGSFSLIRFRSVPGTSREILGVFFSMVIGLACGTGYVYLAGILTLIVCLYILVLTKSNFITESEEKVLSILIPEDLDYSNIFSDILDKYTSSYKLIKTKTTNMGSMYELTYKVKVKDSIKEKEFLDEIRVRNGNLKVSISSNMMEESL